MTQFINLLHLPCALEFRNAALGTRRVIQLGDFSGHIHLPRANLQAISEPFCGLLAPLVRDIAFAERIFNYGLSDVSERLNWGTYFAYNNNDIPNTAVASVSFAVLTLPAKRGGNLVPLSAVSRICLEEMPEWCFRLTNWIEVLTGLDLDAAHSLHNVIIPHRWSTAAWVFSSHAKPRYEYVNAPLQVLGSCGDRAISEQHWSAAVRAANLKIDPPEIRLLLRDARAAQRRDQGRRAILDVATAVELIVHPALRAHLQRSRPRIDVEKLLKMHGRISDRFKLMAICNLWLPPDLQKDVMEVRNRVIHENTAVTKADAARAIMLVEQLADRYAPIR